MSVNLLLFVSAAFAWGATASFAQPAMQPYKGSPEFEQLKSLVGVWEGEMPMEKSADKGEGKHAKMPMKMTVDYRLTAGGSVLQETINAGTPMEMVTMYHDRGGRLSLTHYCMLGNQPKMDFSGITDGQLHFTFSGDNDMDPTSDMFMHSLVMTIADADHIVQRWTLHKDGEAQPAHDMHLLRVR